MNYELTINLKVNAFAIIKKGWHTILRVTAFYITALIFVFQNWVCMLLNLIDFCDDEIVDQAVKFTFGDS